jgi:gas vesicle protein
MFSRVRIAIRFFFVGLAVGVLLAPRSGEDTRRMLREKADSLLNDVLEAASLGASAGTGASGTSATSASSTADDTADASDESESTSGRSGNGSRTRGRSTRSTSEAGV